MRILMVLGMIFGEKKLTVSVMEKLELVKESLTRQYTAWQENCDELYKKYVTDEETLDIEIAKLSENFLLTVLEPMREKIEELKNELDAMMYQVEVAAN